MNCQPGTLVPHTANMSTSAAPLGSMSVDLVLGLALNCATEAGCWCANTALASCTALGSFLPLGGILTRAVVTATRSFLLHGVVPVVVAGLLLIRNVS
jgi:hypothetical protein